MTSITAQPGIMDIELYQSGATHIEGVDNVTKLSSNENPLGPSEAAVKAYQRAAFSLHRYPSSDQVDLRSAIGEVLAGRRPAARGYGRVGVQPGLRLRDRSAGRDQRGRHLLLQGDAGLEDLDRQLRIGCARDVAGRGSKGHRGGRRTPG